MAMRARILLAIPDREQLAAASALVDESAELELAGTAHSPDQIGAALRSTEVDAVILHEDVGALPAMELVRQLATAHPGVGLIALVREAGPGVLRGALQAGARDVIEQPLTLERLQASVSATVDWVDAVREQIASDRSARSERLEAGRVIAVAGAKGGVGTTTIALNLALAGAAEQEGPGPCLVELDLQAGDLRTYLDLPATQHRSVADLPAMAGELNWRSLEDVLYAHEAGLRILLCPERGEDAEDIGDSVMRETLGVIKAQTPLTVVDLGANVTEAGAAAVELADLVLIVATPDVPALRGANRLVRLWDRLDLLIRSEAVAVVLNRVNRAAEIQPELARRVLSCRLTDAAIPAGFRDLENAINSGVPERISSGPIVEGIEQLAVEVGVRKERPRRLRRRGGAAETRAEPAAETGQVAVETVGLVGLITLLVLALWQIVLVGYTFVLAGHSAREGARAVAVGAPGEEAARAEVPGAWRDGLRYEDSHGGEDDEAHAEVSLAVPALIPGLETPLRVTVDESTVVEGEPLPESVQGGDEPEPPPESDEETQLQ
jgi:pilus assembly protein CpaE